MVESIGDYWMQLQKLMDEVGWAIQGVGAGEGFPGVQFAYTVGFTKWEHPECIIVGLDFDTMKSLLNNAGRRVQNGERFLPGVRYTEIIQATPDSELTVGFRECSNELMNSTKHFFGDDFPALQLLWPDTANHLPDDPDFEARFRKAQPLWP